MADDDQTASVLAKQTGITFAGNVLGKVLKFGFVVMVTRLVSPSTYGLYVLAFSIVSLLQSVANLGMDQAVDYYVPRLLQSDEKADARSVLLVVGLVTVIGSFLMGVLVIGAAPRLQSFFGEPGLAFALMLFALAVPLLALQSVLNKLFTAVKRMEYVSLTSNLASPLVQIILTLTLVSLGYGIAGLVVGHIGALVVALLLAVTLAAQNLQWIRSGSLGNVSIKDLTSYSVPLMFAGVVFGIVGQIDFFVLGFFGESGDVGVYRVAYLLAGNIVIFHISLTPVFKPLIVEVQEDATEMSSRYLLATRWVAMVTLPIAATLLIFPVTYLSLLFQPDYSIAAVSLAILVIGQFLNSAVGPTTRILQATGKTRLVLLNTVALVSVNGVLDILLVPRFGIEGAAIGTAVGLITIGALALLEIWYFWGLHPFHVQMGKTWVAIVPGIVGLFALRVFVLPVVAAILAPIAVVLLYYLTLRGIGGFTDDDLEIARRIDNRIGQPFIARLVK